MTYARFANVVDGILMSAAGGQKQSPMSMILLMFALIAISFYFIVLRPQKREQDTRKRLLENLKSGDSIVTIGGIYGTVVDVENKEGTVIIEVAKNVRIKILKSAISTVLNPSKERGASLPAVSNK